MVEEKIITSKFLPVSYGKEIKRQWAANNASPVMDSQKVAKPQNRHSGESRNPGTSIT
jgi:hypothetical protein